MKKKELLTKLKKGIHFDAFNAVRDNKKLFVFILLMDLVFLSVTSILGKLAESAISPRLGTSNLSLLLSIIPVYVLVLAVIHSFTKYFALHYIKNMFKSEKLNIKRVWQFYPLNLIIGGAAFLTVLLLSKIVMGGMKEIYLGWASKIVIAAWFFFAYALFNIAHSLFALNVPFKQLLKKSFRFTFTKIGKYYQVYIVSAAFFAAVFAAYYLLGLLLNAVFTLNILRYNVVFTIISILVLYLLQAYNRVYFFLIVKKIKG